MLPNNIEVLHELSIIDTNSKKTVSEFAIVKYIKKLEKALDDIKKHQALMGGEMAKKGAVWNIANNALIGD